jgi:hypothetical protein
MQIRNVTSRAGSPSGFVEQFRSRTESTASARLSAGRHWDDERRPRSRIDFGAACGRFSGGGRRGHRAIYWARRWERSSRSCCPRHGDRRSKSVWPGREHGTNADSNDRLEEFRHRWNTQRTRIGRIDWKRRETERQRSQGVDNASSSSVHPCLIGIHPWPGPDSPFGERAPSCRNRSRSSTRSSSLMSRGRL